MNAGEPDTTTPRLRPKPMTGRKYSAGIPPRRMRRVPSVGRLSHRFGLSIKLPVEVIEFIAGGGDMDDKSAFLSMDREQALVLADEIRQKALAP